MGFKVGEWVRVNKNVFGIKPLKELEGHIAQIDYAGDSGYYTLRFIDIKTKCIYFWEDTEITKISEAEVCIYQL